MVGASVLVTIFAIHGFAQITGAGSKVDVYLSLLLILLLGASPFPSTNNGLERQNREIKDSHSLRERLIFPKFSKVVERMISTDWSKGFSNPEEIELKFAPHVYVKARGLLLAKRPVLVLQHGQSFAVSSTLLPPSTQRRAIKYLAHNIDSIDFASFDDYKDNRFKVFIHFLIKFTINFRFMLSRRLVIT
jgi:hypothetical protein